METVKKTRPYRSGVVKVMASNGREVTREVITKRSDDLTWDTEWYNFRDKKWERDGERLTYAKAYKRAYHLIKTNPYAKIAVLLVPGTSPGVNPRAPKETVDVGSNA